MPYYEINCGTGRRAQKADSHKDAVDAVLGEGTWKWNKNGEAESLGQPGHRSRYTVRQIPKATAEYIKRQG